MTRLGWIASLLMTLGLGLGVALGWGLCRTVSGFGQTSRLLRVDQIPPREPVRIVPDSVKWPGGDPVTVQTVEPPNNKERHQVESDFKLDLSRTNILGKFDLPQLPDGGKAVVTVPKRGKEKPPLPLNLTVKVNKPPLLRIRWEPRFEVWYGYGAEFGTVSPSRSAYLGINRLACIRDKVCLQARAGREERPWGGGWVAEVGASVSF